MQIAPLILMCSLSVASVERSREQVVDASEAVYFVEMGGTADSFNTRRDGEPVPWGFQPNISLALENIGEATVENPRLTVNGRGGWHDIRAILDEIVEPGMSERDRAFAVWDFVRRTLSAGPTYHKLQDMSITRFLNALGTGACGTYHYISPFLLHCAGLDARTGFISGGSHATQLVYWDGTPHYMDAHIAAGQGQPGGHFPLALDNRSIPSLEEVVADSHVYARAGGDAGFRYMVALMQSDQHFWEVDYEDRERMRWTLRPGERVAFGWEPARYVWFAGDPRETAVNGNGSVRYAPRALPSSGIVDVHTPYPIVGGAVRGAFGRSGRIEARLGGGEWFEVWRGEGEVTADLPRDRGDFRDNCYHTTLEVRLADALAPPVVSATFQTYLPSLPALSLGRNTVRYRDDTPGPRRVRIVHRWRETAKLAPPGRSPGFKPGTESAGRFRWRMPEEGAAPAAWQLFLSDQEDLRFPLLAAFDVVLGPTPAYEPAHFGAFNPGQRYFWSVRARSADGVWGDWSERWTFVADVPARPEALRVEREDERLLLRWEPCGPPGEVSYEVFGDHEPGFSPRFRELWPPAQLGPFTFSFAANRIATTGSCTWDITDSTACYFRVAAVDGKDARSAPSAFVAAPHPLLVGGTLPPAVAGQPYCATLPARLDRGRLLFHLRLQPKGYVYAGADDVRYRLLEGPDWLTLEEHTGVLAGTPVRVAPAARLVAALIDAASSEFAAAYEIPVVRSRP